MGLCNSYNRPDSEGWVNMARGEFGFGRLWRGRGWRHRFFAPGISGWTASNPEEETADLKAQADWLKDQFDAIQKRIEALTSK
jgi:hypothetical protein